MRVLIAEDDFASRKFMLRFFEKYGECDVTVDGKEVDFLVPNKKTTGVICSKDIADEIIAAFK